MESIIPKISLTSNRNDSLSSEEDYDDSDNAFQFGSGNNTDVEDLDSQVYKNLDNICIKDIKRRASDNDLTDIECFNSDVEYIEDEKLSKFTDLKLSLQEFLQYGQKENTSTNNEMHEKVEIKSGNFLLAQNLNGNDYLTDCEEYNTDSDLENNCDKSVCLDIDQSMNDLGNQHIHDNEKDLNNLDVESEPDRLSFVSDITDLGATFADGPQTNAWNVSQAESLEMSGEEEVCISLGDGTDLLSEDDKDFSTQIPSIDVTFVPNINRRSSSFRSNSALNLLQLKDAAEEVLTDIERLGDSDANDDDDDNNDDDSEKPIPHAVIIPSEDDSFCDTEVEQVQIEIENAEDDLENEPMSDFQIKNIPPAHREIIKFTENKFGDTITEIMPMNDNFQFGIYYAHKDDCETDTEDVSGAEECCAWRDLTLPPLTVNMIDKEVILSNEVFKNCGKKRTDIHTNIESVTDVEEIYFAGSARRKKLKARSTTKNPLNKSKYLEVGMAKEKVHIQNDDLSSRDSSEKPVDTNAISSDDDLLSDESNAITNSSVSEYLESNSNLEYKGKKSDVKRSSLLKAKQIDLQQLTDVEDVSLLSDDNSPTTKPCIAKTEDNELHNLLIDSHTVVNEKTSNNFNIEKEKLHIKGMSELRDAHTDTEYVELDEQSDVPIEVFSQSTLPLAPVPKPRSQTVAILRSSDQDLKDDIERPIITDDEGKAPKLEKLISNDSTDITEESDLAETRFYIGESSKNVILKTTPNKEDDENFEETAAGEQEQGLETVEDDEQLENKILRQNSETRNDILELEQEQAAEKKYQKELEQQLEKSEWEISEKKINQVHIEGKSINQEPVKSTTVFSTQIDSNIISKTEGFEDDPLEDSKSREMITKHVVHFTKDALTDEHERIKRSIQDEVSNLNTNLEKHDSYSEETEMKEQKIKKSMQHEVSKIQEELILSTSFEKQDSYLAEPLSKTEMKEQEINKTIQDEVSKTQEKSSFEKQDSYLAETLSKTEMKEQEIKKTIQGEVSKTQEKSSFGKQDSYLAETLSKTEMKEQEIKKIIQDEVSKSQEKSSFGKQDSYLAETLSKTETKEQEIKKIIQDEMSKIQEENSSSQSLEKHDSYLAETLSKTEMQEQEIKKNIQDEVSEIQSASLLDYEESSSSSFAAESINKTQLKEQELKRGIQDDISQTQPPSLLDFEESTSSESHYRSEEKQDFSTTQLLNKNELEEQEIKRNIQDDIPTYQSPIQQSSLLDFEESTSSESPFKSLERHESLIYTQPNSSEYMTAMDGTSTFREGTEYISAMSTFDSTGRSTSSHDSMRSLDSQSEISGQLGTISVSEFTDTLVASSSEAEPLEEGDDMNPELELSDDDNYVDDIDETTECDPNEISLQDEQAEKTLMKRSKEMIFKDIIEKQTEDATSQLVAEDNIIIQSPSYETDTKQADESHITFPISIQTSQPLGHYSMQEEGKIATSLEEASILSTSFSGSDLYEPRHSIDASLIACSLDDGSVLSASFSSTANVETVIENFESGADLPHTEEDCSNKLTEEIFNLESLQDTQTLLSTSMDEISKQQYAAEDSTEKGFESKLLPGFGESKESESESDTDPYESEYVRQFRSPIERKTRRKKQAAAEIDYGLEFEKRPFTPSDLVADIIVEDEDTEKLEEQAAAEHELQKPQQTYANIPDITVTIETQQKDESTERERKLSIDKETELPEEKNLYKVKTQKELNKVTDDALVHSTQKAAREEEKFQKLMEEQYKKKLAQIQDFDINDEQHKADSPDSFEVIEQPDISDEFVIVEEVAKEANEVDLGGQSIDIQAGKIESKHDEEVEKIIIKSAPADPKLGSQIYRDDMNFEFEESPPTTGSGSEVQEESDSNDLTSANKRWIEMQLADNQMRYPYDIAGGVLEDIKEEDAEFEVGSSRISSYKDSFSSTPEYDNMSSRRYATRGEHVDNVSMSSLQEFESLEQAISLENRNKMCHGSTDSSSGSFPRRYIARNTTQGDDISVSSLKEFEGLENACLTAHMVEIKAKEEAALLSRSDESDKSTHSDKEAKPTIEIEALPEKLPSVKESTVEVHAAVAQAKGSSSVETKEPDSPKQRD